MLVSGQLVHLGGRLLPRLLTIQTGFESAELVWNELASYLALGPQIQEELRPLGVGSLEVLDRTKAFLDRPSQAVVQAFHLV